MADDKSGGGENGRALVMASLGGETQLSATWRTPAEVSGWLMHFRRLNGS